VVSPYFRQDEKLVRFVLTKPPDRVSYRMLNPTDAEMEMIRDMGIKAGILNTKIEMKDLLDRSFIPSDIKAADIDMATAGQQIQ
jgi:NitT/TauT family transport system substrate-binding protein